MKYALGNMLNGAGGLNADQLALDLPFAVTKSLTAAKGPTPTFTRASSGTFVGSDGLIQSAGNNVARFDHDPVTLASKGLLVEESRTNLLLQSEDFSTTWTANQLNTTGTPPYLNVETSPSGQTTADKIIANTANSTHQFRQTVTLVGGTAYTLSAYFKAAEHTFATFQAFGVANGSGNWIAFYRVAASSPSIGSFTGFTSISIEDVGNGWRRCIASFTATASGTLSVRIGSATGTSIGNDTFVGDNSGGIFVWGAQLEAGPFATSYIPTTAASVVRSADVCSISGAGFTGMWNATEGSLFTSAIFNAPVAYGTGQILVDFNDGTAANRLRYFRNLSSGTAGFANTSGNSLNVAINGTTALQPFVTQKYSTGFKLDDYAFYVNNSQIGTDNLGAMVVSPTTLTIGDASAGATRQYTNGTISSIRYYRKRLDNSKLASLTV